MTDDEVIAAALEIARRRAASVTIAVGRLFELYAADRAGSKSWRVVEDRLLPFVGAYRERDVMSLRVLDWVEHRARRKTIEFRPGHRYKDLTVNQELTWVKAMLNWAVKCGLVPHNPLMLAQPVKTEKRRRTAPTESDVAQFLERCSPRERYIFLAAVDAGLRRNELLMLCPDWVDVAAKRIHVPAWAAKGKKARDVPLTGRLLDAIRAMPRNVRSPYVLTNPETGEPYNSKTLNTWVRQIIDATGVRAAPGDGRVRLHDLRHSFGTLSCRRGVRLDLVSKFMGHASLQQTTVYAHLSDDDVSPAIEKIEAGIERDTRKGPQSSGAHPTDQMSGTVGSATPKL